MATAFLTDEATATKRGLRAALVPGGIGLALVLVLALLGRGGHAVAAVGAELVGFGAVVVLAKRRIGGFTGDVLGAAGVVGETFGLLMLAARW
jgi:adenosylcobinamide-GDP ribazoletransferase